MLKHDLNMKTTNEYHENTPKNEVKIPCLLNSMFINPHINSSRFWMGTTHAHVTSGIYRNNIRENGQIHPQCLLKGSSKPLKCLQVQINP